MAREPGKLAIYFIVLTVLLDVIGFAIILPVLPVLITDLANVTLSQAATIGGYLLFLYAFMQFLFSPVLGNLSDRFGRRSVLLFSLVAFGVDSLIVGFAPTLLWLFIGRGLAGIAGATYTPANAYIADITPPEQRAQRFGLLGIAFGVGFITGPAIGGFLGEIGPRVPFFFAAGLAFCNALFGYFVLPESLAPENRRSFNILRANPIGSWVAMRKYPLILGLAAAVIFYQIGHDANPALWSYYVMFKFDWTPRDIGFSLAFVGLLMAIVQGGLIRPVIKKIGERRAFVVGLSFAAVGFTGYAFATEGWMMYAFMVPFALMGLAMPSLRAIMSAQVPANEQGELAGALTSLSSLTMIFSPLLLTQLFRETTAVDAVVYFPGAAYLLGAVLYLFSIAIFLYVTRRGFDVGSRHE